MRTHDCYCSGRPWCLVHKAQEWGGGQPDICAPHGHERFDDVSVTIDVDRLTRAMTGLVFMDEASNRRYCRGGGEELHRRYPGRG